MVYHKKSPFTIHVRLHYLQTSGVGDVLFHACSFDIDLWKVSNFIMRIVQSVSQILFGASVKKSPLSKCFIL